MFVRQVGRKLAHDAHECVDALRDLADDADQRGDGARWVDANITASDHMHRVVKRREC